MSWGSLEMQTWVQLDCICLDGQGRNLIDTCMKVSSPMTKGCRLTIMVINGLTRHHRHTSLIIDICWHDDACHDVVASCCLGPCLLTCELVSSRMKAGIFWLIHHGLHPTCHYQLSLSLGGAQCSVVFDIAHDLFVHFSWVSAYIEISFMALVFFLFVPSLKWWFGFGLHTRPWTGISYIYFS